MIQRHSVSRLLSSASMRTAAVTRHHTHEFTPVNQQTRSIVFLPPSQTDEQARRRVLTLYRTILKSIEEVKERFNVPGTVEDMRMRVKLDFLRNSRPLRKDLVDAMVFRAYHELEEMQKHYQTRPHVIKYFAEYEPISRALHAKNRPLSDQRLESEDTKRKQALEMLRSSGRLEQQGLSLDVDEGHTATTSPKESDAASLIRSMKGLQSE